MFNKNINGNFVSKILLEELKMYIDKQEVKPSIIDISIGDDYGSLMYAKMKEKKITKETGIVFQSIHFKEKSCCELVEYIEKLNKNKDIHGIMIQLPLPSYLKESEREILDTIDYSKDIDGLSTIQIGKMNSFEDSFIPCTAWGIETLFKVYDVKLEGKMVAIINRSNIVGRPLENLMLRNNATPIICHSKTKNLKEITRECDIVIAALNNQEYITGEYIKDGAIVIDVGVHKNSLGKTVGDVLYNDVYEKARLITPPIGGVGPMTICMLAYNACKSIYKEEANKILENAIRKAKNIIIK